MERFENSTGKVQQVITSSSNETVKHVRSLLGKKHRDKSRQFIAEGEKIVSEALSSSWQTELLVFSESYSGSLLNRGRELGIRCLVVKDSLFQSLSDTQTPQGVLAVIQQRDFHLQNIIAQEFGFVVILDGVKDPGNLGTIIRTVDAAGAGGIILIHDCVDACNPKAVRATMGSIFRVPLYREGSADELFDNLVRAGWHIAASDLKGTDAFEWQGGFDKTALVIGSESHGVSETARSRAHSLISIPMAGGTESLNASVAAGILIYEIFRKGREMDG